MTALEEVKAAAGGRVPVPRHVPRSSMLPHLQTLPPRSLYIQPQVFPKFTRENRYGRAGWAGETADMRSGPLRDTSQGDEPEGGPPGERLRDESSRRGRREREARAGDGSLYPSRRLLHSHSHEIQQRSQTAKATEMKYYLLELQ
ncbi:hypothetical protein SKAU_G00025530 [Synaphobranchus kaupii]|uniref:Uncharacterized protein n=1 Tax=Synaphobranchus kaupii TaxID=118154 RepID=A0A9Q1GDZ0_SYNKA|nr:hypothetical protein SKAU_G00025530 [Synaphobranchus kaupii]